MTTAFSHRVERAAAWRSPLLVAEALRGHEGLAALIGGVEGPGARWSYVMAEPDLTFAGAADDADLFATLRSPEWSGGGVVGLASYDAGARVATGRLDGADWPDLMLARYPAMLAFDHQDQTVVATGRGASEVEAAQVAERALSWLDLPSDATRHDAPVATDFIADAPEQTYLDAVADVVARIAAGELFQANIARGWSGLLRSGAEPFDVFRRLTTRRGAAYGAYVRWGARAIVSNSPELFVQVDGRRIETRPIKGTRPRHADPARDAYLARELADSDKDRAENLMIVDLMRNDLARVCDPGSVRADRLFDIESLPTVHHLVSTVTGRLRAETAPTDILAATFPPGSITGAPKHQAMKVIARHEPPRGPWCGSLFLLDQDAMAASVLIRTAAFERADGVWTWRAQAGCGIVADSDPVEELAETEAKIAALREAFTGLAAPNLP